MRKPSFVLPALLLLTGACAADDGDAVVPGSPLAAEEPAAAADKPAAAKPDAFVSFKTDEFELGAGKERYLCFTKVLEEDMVIDGYQTEGLPYVHHLIFSRNRVPGKLGF